MMDFETLPNLQEDDLYKYFLNEQTDTTSLIPEETFDFGQGVETLYDLPEVPPLSSNYSYEPIITTPPPPMPMTTDTKPRTKTSINKTTPKRAAKKARVTVKQETKKETHEDFSHDDKYRKRLEANKKSAQLSRERKKNLKIELEQQLEELSSENESLGTEIIQLETENKVLKGEFVQLQKLISGNKVLSKMMDRATSMAIPMPEESTLDTKVPPAPAMNGPFDPAALMYLMMMLQSYNQHLGASAMNGLRFVPTPIAV